MLIMDQIRQVTERYYEGGESLSQIARDMNLAWRTVRKHGNQFSRLAICHAHRHTKISHLAIRNDDRILRRGSGPLKTSFPEL